MPKWGRAYFNENTPHLKLVGAKPYTFKSIYLRDGAVVLHKRADSSVWQVRFKLYDRRWHAMRPSNMTWSMPNKPHVKSMTRLVLENAMD